MPLVRECNVYYDREAYLSYNHLTGKKDKTNPKYRLFVRKVYNIFVFFFFTSQKWQHKKYIDLNASDWNWKARNFLYESSRIDLSDCCKLKRGKILKKILNKKFELVGEVKIDVIDRLRIAYESNNYIIPRRPSTENVPIEFAFAEKEKVKSIGQDLGIF